MDRRDVLALSAATALTSPAFAQRRFEEGVDFMQLEKPTTVTAPKGKIEVIEFFWYKCPHCNRFEPELEAWIKRQNSDIVVRRVPVAFRDDFVPQQRLFYVLEAMGKLDDLHGKIFAAIHGPERKQLDTKEQIADWLAQQGIEKPKFLELYDSFSVSAKARRATELQNAYRVSGVPSMGIAGRFYTDGALNPSMLRALAVTDWLIGEVRKAPR
jgi:protein dithiol oxidoreductase (disulfide-forming)